MCGLVTAVQRVGGSRMPQDIINWLWLGNRVHAPIQVNRFKTAVATSRLEGPSHQGANF